MRAGPLIVGLGNPFMGDGGVGARVLELLAVDGRLPREVELLPGGPDFIRHQDLLRNRTRVILLDAFPGGGDAGAVHVLEDAELRALDPAAVEPGGPHSARQALDLLEQAESELVRARFTVVAVSVAAERLVARVGLSDPVERGAAAARDRVIEILRAEAAAGR